MTEENGYEQAHNVDAFIEPQVHPDMDSYLREKLRRATNDAVREIQDDNLKKLEVPNLYYVGQGRQFLNESLLKTKTDIEITSPEIQRLRSTWSAAARGDFTDINTELVRDMTDVTTQIDQHRQSTDYKDQMDVEAYDSYQENINEWQAGLKETPIDLQNTRLGQQINRTVVHLIAQRDSTRMGELNKNLRTLQRIQKTIPTFPAHLPGNLPQKA